MTLLLMNKRDKGPKLKELPNKDVVLDQEILNLQLIFLMMLPKIMIIRMNKKERFDSNNNKEVGGNFLDPWQCLFGGY